MDNIKTDLTETEFKMRIGVNWIKIGASAKLLQKREFNLSFYKRG